MSKEREPGKRSKISFLSFIKMLIATSKLLWVAGPVFFVSTCLLSLVQGLLPISSALINAQLIDLLIKATQVQDPIGRLLSPFLVFLLLLAVIRLASQFSKQLGDMISSLYQMRLTNSVQLRISQKASELDMAFFEDPAFSNLMFQASSGGTHRPMLILMDGITLVTTLCTGFTFIAVVFLWQPWIVPVLLLLSFVQFRVTNLFARKQADLTLELTPRQRQTGYIQAILSEQHFVKELRFFSLGKFFLQRLSQHLGEIYQQNRRLASQKFWSVTGTEILLALTYPLLLGFTMVQVLTRAISIGQFTLYAQAISQIQSSCVGAMNSITRLYESQIYLSRLFQFLETQPAVEAPRENTASLLEKISPNPKIEFRNVSFCYPDTENFVLKNLTFTIYPGEAVALVGENGAGKSTAVKLLAGLYEPTEGQIFLDEVDISLLNRHELRSYLSAIFQDFMIYYLSLAENVGIGSADNVEDQARIEDASRRSGLDRLVETLPEGYQAMLGRFIDDGHILSGGQSQLVALARALMRKAPILVLDEPSAALDIYTEQRFFQRLLEQHQQGELSTLLFIAHRFGSISHAERILLLEDGTLLEEGTHEELLACNGRYAEMFNMQAKLFQETPQPEESGSVLEAHHIQAGVFMQQEVP
jgi:ATP-binding cassette subfamily B protein